MSLGKHFINAVEDPVTRGLKSLLQQDHSLRLIESQRVIYSKQSQKKVLLLSGGGSGHEPAHAGYLGVGMLDICVAGDIFASPSATQVLAGLKALKSPLGILMIVKNYTGDKLNFGLAAQKAHVDGINANVVFVGDDVSIEGNDLVGRRGLSGVVLVHKLAGALAETGAALEEVTKLAQNVADNLITVGVTLDRCSVPRREGQESLPFEELEYGMGIHNEPGARRENIAPLPTIIANVLDLLKPRSRLPAHKQVAIMINNLGGLSVLEINVIAEETIRQIGNLGLDMRRTLVGTFVSSLDGPGFSVTILGLDPGMEDLLNAWTTAPAWPNQIPARGLQVDGQENEAEQMLINMEPQLLHKQNNTLRSSVQPALLKRIVHSVLEFVQQDEPLITKYDTIAGDGDCGETLLKGVNAIHALLGTLETNSASSQASIFRQIAATVEQSMGGTSGALYALFMNAVANSLHQDSTSVSAPSEAAVLAKALSHGLKELCRYTAARKGHKTLMDALIPFVETFAETLDLNAAVKAAGEGAESTRALEAVLGRASYVGREAFDIEGGVPDPGALGVVSVLRGIQAGIAV